MKRFALAVALACALSATVVAGEIPSTGAPAPASSGTTQTGIAASVILTILGLVR